VKVVKEDKKNGRYKGILIVGLIFITYIFFLINLPKIWGGLTEFSSLFTPFILGFIIAYLISPLINTIKKIFSERFNKKCPHGIAMLISYLLVTGLIAFLFINILPQIWLSIKVIVTEIPKSIELAYAWLETDGSKYISEITNNRVMMKDILDIVLVNLEPMFSNMKDTITTLFNTTSAIIGFLLNFILGILISIYMLMHRDTYIAQMKKVVFAFFKDYKAREILEFWGSVNTTFSRFINARIIDSSIIGILCWLGCIVLGFENSLLIAFIVGVTNVIPYFGPFIGAVPCSLIVLLQSPMDMIIFIIFILILQQFDGNILGPKLLGDSLGLTSFWIIFSVAIMTGIFGIAGMVIGVPLFAIIYMLIKDFINDRLEKKGKSTNTNDYLGEFDNIDYVIDLSKHKKD
jgi:predicted PurR-regulated permease PerM